uniref:Leucine-rich repeat-containing protein 51 n=1 Tax=Panagrellus redivivus TaxID=6233 RepID=A0A7E4USY6_PANRE
MALSAARGVTQVMHRCDYAKETRYLDLSGCNMMYVADAIYMVLKGHQIAKVSLANNDLKKFPSKMTKKFPELMCLNLSGNKVTEIPDDILEWTNLGALNLSGNKFTQFPEVIYKLKNLKLLDISNNEIQNIDIPRLFTELPLLKILDISNNTFPEDTIIEILSYQATHAPGVQIKHWPAPETEPVS